MPQYLNPYEGIGNSLIAIGQNYDLDRRRKKEAEEDQKRRRADYKWQSQQEEEADQRKWEREAPEREAAARLAALREAKAAADLVRAQMDQYHNLPGGMGAIKTSLVPDGKGGFTAQQERMAYVPQPERQRQVAPRYFQGLDEAGNISLIEAGSGNITPTTLRPLTGQQATGLTPAAIAANERARLKANNDIEKADWEGLGLTSRATPEEIKRERQRRIDANNRAYDDILAKAGQPPSATAPAPAQPRSFGASALGAVGQGLMNIGNALTTTEADIAAGIGNGTIPPEKGAAMLAAMSGGDVSVDLSGNKAETSAPKPKEQKGKDAPGSSADNPIDATTLTKPPKKGTWIRTPKGKVVQVD